MRNVSEGPWTKRFIITLHPHVPSRKNLRNREEILTWLSDGLYVMFSDAKGFLRHGTRWKVDPSTGKRVDSGVAPVRFAPVANPVQVEYQFEEGPVKRQIHAHIIVTVHLADSESNVDIRPFHLNHHGGQKVVYGRGNPVRHAWWYEYWNPRTIKARSATSYTWISPDRFAWNVRTIWSKDPAKATYEYITKMITKVPEPPPGGPSRNPNVQQWEQRSTAYGGYVARTDAEAQAIRNRTTMLRGREQIR